MEKTYELELRCRHEYDERDYEEIYDDSGKKLFGAYNLTDCPEDAVIWRSLFNAKQYIDAVALGMKLREDGYTKINVTTVEDSETED